MTYNTNPIIFLLQAMMNRLIHVMTWSLMVIVWFLIGCEKSPTSEEERLAYYELNRQNSLRMFKPIMYNTSDGDREELFKIVHFSDAHISAWSHGNQSRNPNNIREAVLFANDTSARINAMVATGDHINNIFETTRNEVIQLLNIFTNVLYHNNTIPTFTITGNHDANMLNPNYQVYALSKLDLHSLLTSKIPYPIHSEGFENYYYADLINQMGGTIRIIGLDVTDQDNFVFSAQHNAILSQKQIDWLCHTALKKDMTQQHSVIILIHHPLPPQNEELSRLVNNFFLHDWNMLPEIIETFRTKQALTQKYPHKFIQSDSISVDVSFENSPGEFICYLGGHLHTYLDYEVKSTMNSPLPNQIMIIANNMSPTEKSETTHIERSESGLRNNTFNMYAIDTKKKVIYVTFFGATGFYYPNIIERPYL